jgi:serine/threonine-protein phosphatase Stp1
MNAVSIARPLPGLTFQSASRSHAGARRSLNEDRVLDRDGARLWAIADGMGGHSAGDVAAARVVAALEGIDHGASGFAYLDDILAAASDANAAIFGEQSLRGGQLSGATLVALVAHDGHYACLWAGDSRAYRFRDGTLTPITRDHSLVQQLIDTGALDEASRKQHPNAHMITRAIGVAPDIELERRFAPIMAGDVFLLCSDGLTACLDDHELASLLAGADPNAAADRLLATALDRGARDNVSLIVIQASPEGS